MMVDFYQRPYACSKKEVLRFIPQEHRRFDYLADNEYYHALKQMTGPSLSLFIQSAFQSPEKNRGLRNKRNANGF